MINEKEIPIKKENFVKIEDELDNIQKLIEEENEGQLMDKLNETANSIFDYQKEDENRIISKLEQIKKAIQLADFQESYKGVTESMVENIEDKLRGK